MPSYACRRCGHISEAKVCETCAANERDPNAHWSKDRNRAAQARFRKRLMAEYGGQCGAVVNGARCAKMTDLHAHHTHPGDDTRGVLLCREHHRAVDRHAR